MLVVAAAALLRSLVLAHGPTALGIALLVIGLGGAMGLLALLKNLSLPQLRTIEIAVFAMAATYLAVQCFHSLRAILALDDSGLLLSGWNWSLMLFLLLTVTYGITIPNTAMRAAFVVLPLSATPLAMAGILWARHPELGGALARIDDSGWWINGMVVLFLGAVLAVFAAYVVDRFFHTAFEARLSTMYDLEEKIGHGGMGEVWRARHQTLARPAAVKLIREEMIDTDDKASAGRMLQRFKREAKATAALRSPHTVEIYDFGVARDGTFFYAMEYLDGLDLESMVTRFGPLPGERAVYLLRQACDSLADAHRNLLTHRDVKPANIYACQLGVSYDYVKLLDFGLVSSTAAEDVPLQLTAEDTTSGTPAYMAPEMAVGKDEVDGRADLYALGCVGYWLLTGKQVFEGDTPVAVLVEHVKTAPVPPSQRTEEIDIPSDLERVILKCLEKDPADRYQSAEELSAALAACELPECWDSARAKEWWDLHLPRAA
jgi:serine/threonine-protein kinase